MILSEELSKIIAAAGFTSEEKSIMVLLFLEYKCNMSLYGNGWIDDDPKALAAFDDDEQSLLKKMREVISV